jgi:hypothetical protein
MQNMLVEDHPSSKSSDLELVSSCVCDRVDDLTQTTPHVSIALVQLKNLLQVVNSFVKLLLRPQYAAYSIHGRNRACVCPKGMFICNHGFIEIAKQFCKAPYDNLGQ